MSQTDPRSNGGAGQASSQARHEQPTPATEVPERPTLAPDVQLVGEMPETGFTERQWLVKRGDRFVQITELLYRVVEQMDGERTLEEIAERVTESTEWLVSADSVRQLIQIKLIPAGLVTPAGGVTSGEAPSRDRTPSPLALNIRIKTIGPRVIDPITRVLQFLYAPLVLVPVLVAITIAHGWLYFVHGVVGSVLEAFYTPGLLLVVLVIVLVSGVFHEFGHASALRYGGGQVRGMGVGIYIIYPAFYTDVSDSYRLGRWARVRTGLGGFYFQLIFTLGVIGLYLASGQEFLLFVVLLIDLNIIYQCLPFVRLDGYWVLADLTGIPDFFSQMGPFIRSVLPVPGWAGSRLPDLKPWVKAVFATYIVLTVPVLAFLLFLFVRRAPGILAAMWDSLLNVTADLSAAWGTGSVVGVAASVSQMLILALVMVGIAYLFYALGRGLARAVWNWSKPTPARRVAGVLITIGAVAGLVFLWSPNLQLAGRAAPAGVQSFEVAGRDHVRAPVSYPQTPPVGGNHAPVWQNCGFYEEPVTDENVVHSLEHGAVWIAYRPGLPEEQIDSVRQLAQRQNYVLASPYPGIPTSVVVSAWGRQLRLEGADDPRLDQFVRAFRLGPQAPESGGLCTGGIGTPE
jgi:putative peptide zinc metalloprotease protein